MLHARSPFCIENAVFNLFNQEVKEHFQKPSTETQISNSKKGKELQRHLWSKTAILTLTWRLAAAGGAGTSTTPTASTNTSPRGPPPPYPGGVAAPPTPAATATGQVNNPGGQQPKVCQLFNQSWIFFPLKTSLRVIFFVCEIFMMALIVLFRTICSLTLLIQSVRS